MKPNELRQGFATMESLSQEIKLLRQELQTRQAKLPQEISAEINRTLTVQLAPVQTILTNLSHSLFSLQSVLAQQVEVQRINSQTQASQITALMAAIQQFEAVNNQPLA